MSYIDYTRSSSNSAYEMTVCMTKKECKTLLPFFRTAYKNIRKKYDRYEDIHEGGEATEKQENLRMKYTEELGDLESIISEIEIILKQ
ncbi:hypothetical protein DXB29_19200 [Bacteroides sp. 3_1_33FAA]|nr:hypothetical protein DXB29_19200 [Bacteroides sp. 3_1_33FAA]